MPALYTRDGSGARIVPPGDAAEEFCLCSFVRASASGYAAATGLLALPGFNRGVLPLLCADGSVYLPSCPVIDSGGNWSAGGYLGIVTCDVAVTYPAFVPFDPPSDYPLGQTETIRVEALGVIPSAFSYGLRLDGISVPPAGLENVSLIGRVFEEMRRRGYDEESVEKVAGKNLLDVMKRVKQKSYTD